MTDRQTGPEINALLHESRVFPPPPAWRESALVTDPDVYARAAADPEAFWASFARELDWIQPWTQVLDWKPPHAKWFVGGRLNISANCLDRHVRTARRNTGVVAATPRCAGSASRTRLPAPRCSSPPPPQPS